MAEATDTGAAATAAAAAATSAAATAAAALTTNVAAEAHGTTPWYSAVAQDAELTGHIKNRGWDGLTPADAAVAAIKAHKEAEKLIGAPANEVLRLPKAEDTAGQSAMWQRLGRPETADKYDFSAVKHADGSVLKPEEATKLAAGAFEANLTQAQALALVSGRVKEIDGGAAETSAVNTATLAEQTAALKANWGVNYDANMLVAKNTALRLGVKPEQVAALEGQIGYSAVMSMFQNIGTKIGEATFVNNLNPAIPGVMARDQAVARKAELMTDTVWRDKYMAGDTAANREMLALNTIIVGEG